MATSNKSTGETLFDLTSYVVDTHASRSAQQANAKEKTTLDTCGLEYEKPLADYDPDTQSWKMFGDTYLWGESPLLENLPPSGMTRNGVLFPQPQWEPLTGETESSSWPTPTASDWKGRGPNSQQQGLPEAVKRSVGYWPTPRSSSAMNEDIATLTERLQNGTPYKARLEEAIAMWPTPRAAMGETRNHTVYARSSDKPQNLENKVASTEPTAIGGKLNPTWVEWLMGFPPGWTDLED